MVSTPLKNISQLGWLLPIYGKKVPNHQPVDVSTFKKTLNWIVTNFVKYCRGHHLAAKRWRMVITKMVGINVTSGKHMVRQAMQIWSNQYIYIYNMYPPQNRRFWGRNVFGTNYPVQLECQWGGTIYIYIYIIIYIYTHLGINCCLTVEPRYLEQFCHQKRLQTFANETGSRFKIQGSRFKKNFLNPETLLLLALGFKENPEPVSFANVCKRFWWQNCSKYLALYTSGPT